MRALLLSAPEICELQDTKVRLEGEVKMLRDALVNIQDYWNGGYESAVDAIEHSIEVAIETLRMTEAR